MVRTSQVLRIVIIVAVVLQVILGLYVWGSGNLTLLPGHIVLGLLLIGALWLATVLANRAGVGFGRSIAVLVLSLLLPVFGMAQVFVPSGPANWVLMALHMGTAGAAVSIALKITRMAQDQFASGAGRWQSATGSLGHANA